MSLKILDLLTGDDQQFSQGLLELGWYDYAPLLTEHPTMGKARTSLNPQLKAAGEVRETDAWVYRLNIQGGKWQDAVAVIESQLKAEPQFAVVFCTLPGALLILVPSNPDKAFGKAKGGLAVDRIYLDTRRPSNFEDECIKKLKEAPKKHFRARLQEMVNTERVTKKFYDRFKKELDNFQKLIDGITADTDRLWYSSVMLNRLMFIYFLQRKGFLDGNLDYLSDRLEKVQQRRGKGEFQSFYRIFLLRLFHEGLGSRKRESDFEELLGRVPYLNGGLFDVHAIESRYRDDVGQIAIDIPDEAFEQIFAFFNDYEWCLDTRPSRTEREINPDVLGYIFEKYINQKQMGAYYTKEDITEYISKNTIIPYLFDAAAKKHKAAFDGEYSVWRLLRDDPDRYIYDAVMKGVELDLPEDIAAGLDDVSKRGGWNTPAPEDYALPTEIWREVVARRKRYQEVQIKLESGEVRSIDDLITFNLDIRKFAQDVIDHTEDPDLIRAIWNTMAGKIPEIGTNASPIPPMTVLDPTCGSGAFLFAALNILEPLYEGCLERMLVFVMQADSTGESRKYPDFRSVLDRMNDTARHPNREYFVLKSIILNNLYGVDMMEEAVEICKLRLFLKMASVVKPDESRENYGLEPLPDIDFNIRAGNTLVGFATHDEVQKAITSTFDFDDAMDAIEGKAEIVEIAYDLFRQQQTALGGEVTAEDKQALRAKLADLESELNRHLANQYGDIAKDYEKWLASHQPFHWFVEFYGIMKRGGFDVIIGNPPYVEYNKVKQDYQVREYRTLGCGNIYTFVLERCGNLANQCSRMGVIVPSGGFATARMHEYQQMLPQKFPLLHISFFSGDAHPSVLFDGVKYRLAIILGCRRTTSPVVYTSEYLRWYAEERPYLFAKLSYMRCPFDNGYLRYCKLGSHEPIAILTKMLAQKTLLGKLERHIGNGKLNYHRSPVFWIRAMDFEPYFKSATRTRSEDHLRELIFDNTTIATVVGSMINSTCFYLWFILQGNCRDIAGPDVSGFPLGTLDDNVTSKLELAFANLMNDLKQHSQRRVYNYQTSGRVEYDEFYPRLSKACIDEIDRALAKHYGFTDEELDFIINYDIKYRMGINGGGDAEESA